MSNTEGGSSGKKRSLDIRSSGNAVGVLPAVKMPVSRQSLSDVQTTFMSFNSYPFFRLHNNYVAQSSNIDYKAHYSPQ